MPGRRRRFIRDIRAGTHVEMFLVAAVATVLAVRFYLSLTGYPRVGGEILHVAHVLWGGLLMMAAIVIKLSFLSRRSTRLAAVVGGVGFGLFVDELGKFLTSDNDYFFRPAVAIIYVLFVLIVIATRTIRAGSRYSEEEYLMNALKEMEEVVRHDLDEEEKARALRYLDRSNPANPLVPLLGDLLRRVELVPSPAPALWTRVRRRLRAVYARVADLPGFDLALILFFVGQLVLRLGYVFMLVFLVGLGWEQVLDVRFLGTLASRFEHLSFIHLAQFASSLIAGVFVFLGVVRLRRNRLSAYRNFKLSVLITIFLTQIFIFYEKQFEALVGLGFNIVILVILDYMIGRERSRDGEDAPPISRPAGPERTARTDHSSAR